MEDYLSSEHADFLARQQQLARAELGLVPVEEQGDFARTLMDLSAVLAHILGVYQDRYARESFLGTARSARSLVRHGRRLGYEPDPGLAAMGFMAFTVHPGLEGWIRRGFALSSSPVGEKKAQSYETLEDVHVSAAHNQLHAARRTEPVALGGQHVLVQGTGHRLRKGEVVVLQGPGVLHAMTVEAVEERSEDTRVQLDGSVPERPDAVGFKLLAKPEARLRPFAWNAPANAFQDSDLRAGAFDEGATLPHTGYQVPGYKDEELFLTPPAERTLLGEVIVRVVDSQCTPFTVESTRALTVTLRKQWQLGQPLPNEPPPPEESTVFSGAASAVTLTPSVNRRGQDLRNSVWLSHWSSVLPLVEELPSARPVNGTLQLSGTFEGLGPGQHVIVSTLDGQHQEVVQLTEVFQVAQPNGGVDTQVSWRPVDPEQPEHSWKHGDIKLSGNVVAVSHGLTVEQILGDSDGTQPFLRFALDDGPLTYLPGVEGAEPVIEVQVGGVLWKRVADLQESDADDRHYILLRDEAQMTHVVFGDGLHGAVPPAGKRHIVATYRVGSGVEGNAAEGLVSRVVQAHPLVARVVNPRSIQGGADPARAQEIRAQSTRFIKTFDRAVSVQDHADIALLFPGVARASAYWHALGEGVEGVRLVVATSQGTSIGPQALKALRSFLEARRDGQVPLVLTAPVVKQVSLSLYLEVAPGFLVESVRQEIREVLHGGLDDAPGLLTFRARGLGQALFLSEVYEAVNRIPGVAYVAVRRLVKQPDPLSQVLDMLTVGPDEWLHLAPESLVFTDS
jgi:hypothetical protein